VPFDPDHEHVRACLTAVKAEGGRTAQGRAAAQVHAEPAAGEEHHSRPFAATADTEPTDHEGDHASTRQHPRLEAAGEGEKALVG
jgi:hypothetical protein